MAERVQRTPHEHLRVAIERAHALLLLAPAAFLAWAGPRAPLEGDPTPLATGTGIAALASVLALALLVTRRVTPRVTWAWAFLGFVAAGLVSMSLQPPSDTFEASRATILSALCLVLLVCGASQSDEGREWLGRGLVLLTLLALAPALFDGANGFSGALGNTGSTSEVALLGGAAGAWMLARAEGAWKWIGGIAAASYAFYVGVAPVLAGALSFALALALLVLVNTKTRALSALMLAVCLGLFGAGRLVPHAPLPASARPAASAPGDVGGLAVRQRIWRSVPALIADYGLLGAGPGQFRAAYPPYRDPEEIELSSHDRTLPRAETEVEHAHSDLLQAFVDAGPIGGALWLAFLGAVAWRALAVLRKGDYELAALGAAALAVMANGALREPLLYNPASASAAFAVFGALLAADSAPGERTLARRLFTLLAMAALATQLSRAWSIAWHGRALRQYIESKDRKFAALAGEFCEDSALARAIAARELEALDGERPTRATVDAWRSVLDVRPHNIEALIQLGLAQARTGQPEAARAAWSRALTLDPRHPALRKNLARMEALVGDVELAEQHLREARLDATQAWPSYANSALRELRVERGWQLCARIDPRFEDLNAQLAYDLARDTSFALDEDLRLALEGSAHLSWAREHGAGGSFADAARSYRQAKRCLAPRDGGAPPNALLLELAGALAASGKVEEARKELASVDATALELARLPTWAGQALLDNGLLGS